MDQIAFYTTSMSVTWHGLIMAAAIVSAVILAMMLCRVANVSRFAMLMTAAGSLILSPLLSRLIYWYGFSEQYKNISEALFSFSNTGHSLLGAIIGVLLSALITTKTVHTDWLSLTDCIAPAGMLGIAVGRLASAFTTADYSWIIFDSPAQQRFPLSLPVAESGSGTVAWRFPTFAYESFTAAVICVILLVMFTRRLKPDKHPGIRGSVTMMCILMFSTTQFVLDSTRYDKLTFPFNGFVSILQIACGAVGITAAMAFFVVRIIKASKNKPTASRVSGAAASAPVRLVLCVILIVVSVILLAVSGMMEYEVQRHMNQYAIYYPPMLTAMLTVAFIGYLLCRSGEKASAGRA